MPKLEKIVGQAEVLDGKVLVLDMETKDVHEFALNWLRIYNNAREHKDVFLTCKLFLVDTVEVLTTLEDFEDVKKFLEAYGTVKVYDEKYRLIDYNVNYDIDYDVFYKDM